MSIVTDMTEVLASVQKYRTQIAAAMPIPSTPDGYDEVRGNYITGIKKRDLQRITEAVKSLGESQAAIAPQHRIYLTQNEDDPYGGNLQNAIDACEAPTAAEPWIVDILSPGVYEGNFVGREHVYLYAASVPTSTGVVLHSASGHTLTLPETNSGIFGLSVISESPNAGDSAIRIVPAGAGDPTRLVLSRSSGLNQAASIRCEAGTGAFGPVVCICLDGNGDSPVLADILGGGIVLFNGGFTNNLGAGGTCIRAAAGTFTLILTAILQNGPGAGWIVDSDGGSVFCFDVRGINTGNLFRSLNGGTLGLASVIYPLDPAGTVLETDIASATFLGNLLIGTPPYNIYDHFVAPAGAIIIHLQSLDFATGTTAPADTRPLHPKPGMRFLATNLGLGGGLILTWNGTAWIQYDGTIVP